MSKTTRILLLIVIIIILGALVVGVMGMAALLPFRSSIQTTNQTENGVPTGSDMSLANPASEYCLEQGYTLQMLEDIEGNQYGICIFPNGDQCDEWAFYRGECGPNTDD